MTMMGKGKSGRSVLTRATLAMIGTLLVGVTAGAAPIDLNTPEGATLANRKIQCSTEDNKPVLYTWEGSVFSRRMGEADERMFKTVGMNIRACVTVDGGKKGMGYRLVTREILLYLDPKTGEALETWDNPWTNTTVNMLHVANDPVNQPASFPYDDEGKPRARWYGRNQNDTWFLTAPVPLFYHNELGGEYQQYVGGAYHATELFNFMGDIESLTSEDTDTAEAKVGWVRISDWLPWMEMQGREGIIYIHAAGQKVDSFDDMPDVMKRYIAEKEPDYVRPPPGDDDRPNETSWTYFKKKLKGGKLPRGGHN